MIVFILIFFMSASFDSPGKYRGLQKSSGSRFHWIFKRIWLSKLNWKISLNPLTPFGLIHLNRCRDSFFFFFLAKLVPRSESSRPSINFLHFNPSLSETEEKLAQEGMSRMGRKESRGFRLRLPSKAAKRREKESPMPRSDSSPMEAFRSPSSPLFLIVSLC